MSNAEIFGVFKKAAKLTKDRMNGCRVVFSMRHFALPPRYLGRLKKGAMEVLQSEIGRYSESLHAVPLAYSDLQLLQKTGSILDDQPHVHFDITFKAVVFQPSISSVLKCVVNEFAGDHVSCLVHNWFNLSLPISGPDVEKRMSKGSKVTVRVTKITGKNGILAIQGMPVDESVESLPSAELPENAESVSDQTAFGKQKHDSGFFSETDDSLVRPPEVTSSEEDDQKKKQRNDEERDSEIGKIGTGLIENQSESVENINTSDRKISVNDNGDSPEIDDTSSRVTDVSQDVSVDGISPKKKKKKKRKREADLDVRDIVIKEEDIDLVADSVRTIAKVNNNNDSEIQLASFKQRCTDITSEDINTSLNKKKKKKKKREGDFDHQEVDGDASINEGHSKKKKKKKKRRDDAVNDEGLNVEKDISIKTELNSDGQRENKKKRMDDGVNYEELNLEKDISVKTEHNYEKDDNEIAIKKELSPYDSHEGKKKKLKRKLDHLTSNDDVISNDKYFRTSHNETTEEFYETPRKKRKKKKKKHKKERQ